MILRAFVLALALFVSVTATAQSQSNAQIQYLSEQLVMGAEVQIDGASLATSHLLPEFYSRREFTPAWTSDTKIDEFIKLVGNAADEGLNPSDYLIDELSALRRKQQQNPGDAEIVGELDVLLTESLARYGNHLLFGCLADAMRRLWIGSPQRTQRSPRPAPAPCRHRW